MIETEWTLVRTYEKKADARAVAQGLRNEGWRVRVEQENYPLAYGVYVDAMARRWTFAEAATSNAWKMVAR